MREFECLTLACFIVGLGGSCLPGKRVGNVKGLPNDKHLCMRTSFPLTKRITFLLQNREEEKDQ